VSLNEIVKLVRPPKNPICTGTATSWLEVQHHFREVLPECLNEYGRTFGSGEFEGSNYVQIYNPHDPEYSATVDWECRNYKRLREDSPQYFPYPSYPEEKGLFPIGHGVSRISFWIQLSGNPEDYLMLYDDQSNGFVEFAGMAIFDFFFRFFCNEIETTPYFTEPILFRQVKLPKF